MNELLLEKYIREKIFLIKEEVSIQGSGAGPTFGQLAAFVDAKNTIANIKNAGEVNIAGVKIKPFKMLITFASHYTGAEFIKGQLKKSGIDLDDLKDVGLDADQAIGSFIKSCEKAVGFGFSSMNPEKILKKFYGINSDSGLERINMPANVSKLIDDKVEEAFFDYLWPSIKSTCKDEPSTVIPEGWILGEFYRFLQGKDGKGIGAKDAIDDMYMNKEVENSAQKARKSGDVPIDRLDPS